MNSDEIKAELKTEVRKYVQTINKLPIICFHQIEIMQTIDKLPIICFHQIEIMQCYVFSKVKWRFSVYHLTETIYSIYSGE